MKRSSRKKRLAKLSKLGLSLAAVTVLGGLVEPGVADFGLTKVYAETYTNTSDQPIVVVVHYHGQNLDGTTVSLTEKGEFIEFQPGQEIAALREFEGYTLTETSYVPPAFSEGLLMYSYTQVETAKQPEPVGDTSSTDTPSVPQPTNSLPTVEERFDVLHIQYREDETDESMGDDFIKVYSSSPKKITPPAFEGYEFKEASVGESNTLYRKPISLPYEHRFAQVLTEQDLNNHSNFLGGRIKEALDYLRDGSGYTYILNYRRTSPVQQDPQAKRVRFEIEVKPDGAPESGVLSYDSASRRFVDLHPGESYTFPVDESKFEIRPNQKLTYSYDEVEAGKDYSISVRPKAVTSQPADKPIETPTAPQPAETPKQPEPAGDTNSTDTNTVNYTVQLVDENGETLQTIQQSGVEGTEVSFEVPVISGYRVGKTEGFDSWTYGKGGTFRLVANKTVKIYYDKAPSIDSLIRPEQRVEYQKVFDEFHTTILKAFEAYKKELGVDNITYEANDLEKIFADSNLSVLHSELVLVQPLFAKPVGLVLTDQDIINAIGWTPEYWDHQIAYHKEIIQKLEKALANIAASKVIPTVPVDQSITIKAVYTEEQIEPGQKVDVLKEIEYTLNPGESIVLEPLTFEGWTSRVAHERQTVTYEDAKNSLSKRYTFYYLKDYTIPTDKQVEQPVETPTEQPVEQPVEIPTAKPTEQSAQGKQATKQGDKEQDPSASSSQKEEVKPASTSQSQAKSLPATGDAHSVLHMIGLGLLGLAGLVVKRRSGKSS